VLTRNRAVLSCVLLLSTLAAAPHASAVAIIDSATYAGHTYYLLDPATWLEAESAAVGLGGHLVTIDDAAENAFVSTRFGRVRGLWIGLTDRDVEGQFNWVSGASLVYTNWAPGEPNDCHRVNQVCTSEDFGMMYQDYGPDIVDKWNDLTNDLVPLSGVVEVVPEPSSLVLFALGASTLSRRLRRRRH